MWHVAMPRERRKPIGNQQVETGNMGVTGNHGKGVEAGHGNDSGRRAEYAKGVLVHLQQRTSGQFTHQEVQPQLLKSACHRRALSVVMVLDFAE